MIYFDRKNDLYLYTTDKEDTMKRIIMSLATLVATAFLAVQPALAAPAFGNPAFARVWDRQDRKVPRRATRATRKDSC